MTGQSAAFGAADKVDLAVDNAKVTTDQYNELIKYNAEP
jgi:hypothetical protein